jgi:hypothetical protein
MMFLRIYTTADQIELPKSYEYIGTLTDKENKLINGFIINHDVS